MRTLRVILKTIAAALVAAVLLFTGGALIPRPSSFPEQTQSSLRRTVLLLSNPIHTDIAFPADPDVLARFSILSNDTFQLSDPRIAWIIVGWGGRSFYLETPTWADLKFMPLMRGLTVDRSTMHVEPIGAIDTNQPQIERLSVDPAAFDAMLQHTIDSFQMDTNGKAMMIEGAGYGLNDRFFEANGYFTALAGCNTWTSAVLRSGNLRTGLWNPLPQSLVWSLKQFNTAQGNQIFPSGFSASKP
ncbi:TIGR02117 family protein [Phyllobacterium sp. 628]|uniref:TIGR02117 family protein n=1 Tax=Phyllobacterium sp. 628 TaxID=2718938 RepID=UPI001662381F|nr:TIGR02117 family protein [Phyllobacterium sp. 628]QND52598.1 TIGR02117 family protein [Phyllobacterium sp. 628]